MNPREKVAFHEGTKTQKGEKIEKRLKFIAPLRNERTDATSEHADYLGLENIQSWTGKLLQNATSDISEDDDSANGTANVFYSGDVLFGKLRPYLAKAFHADKNGVCSTELLVLKPQPDIHPRFLLYSMLSSDFVGQVNASTFGAKMPRANWEFIGSMKLPIPIYETQRLIADYLDRETARIDALVTEKEKMLTLLEEKRSTLISRAVTRGLDPTVPLKPSGLDWLGDIPAHWDIRRLKFVSDSLDQGSSPVAANSPAGPDELGIVKLSAVNKGRFRRDENKALRESDGQEQVLSLRKGDVLITRGNTPDLVADVACVPSDEPNLLLPDLVYRLRVREDQILPEFLTFFLTTGVARSQIQRDARGSSGSMVKVSQGHVLDWQAPIPPIVEQFEIVGEIQAAEIKSVPLFNNLVGSISLLHERRNALITAAVTDQIPGEEMSP